MRYFIFLTIIALCIAPVIAQTNNGNGNGNGNGDTTPQMNPTAQNFITKATDFVNTNLSDVQGFNKQQYLDELNAIVSQIDETKDLSHFDVDSYMSGVSGKVSQMLATEFPKYTEQGSLKNEYLKETANFFIKEYANDMKNDIQDIATSAYLEDFASLNSNYASKLQALNTPPSTANTTMVFDPNAYLDKACGTKSVAKMDFYWGGVNNHWLNYNMVALVERFQNSYNHNSVVQADFGMLKKMWPQSAEVYLMNTSYTDAGYVNGHAIDDWRSQSGAYKQSYVVDEYGGMNDPSNPESQFDVGSNVTTTNIGTYNNRSYGYRYSNRTAEVLSITTNGRRYTVTENVYTSPLVLDLDGDGAIQASNGQWLPHPFKGAKVAEFDMTGDGFADITEWVGPKDGLLLVYNEKKEVDANDLFGNAGGFDHGYEKLSLFDKNNDKVISDEELAPLSVWRDLNGDAKVDKGEVVKVQEIGITSISLNYDDNLVSSFVQNGQEKKVVDWYPYLYEVKKTK